MTPNPARLSGVVAVVTGCPYGASKWGLRGADASPYMTGAELAVDGGASAGRIPIVSP